MAELPDDPSRNPAARLEQTLLAFLSRGGNSNSPALDVWALVFEVTDVEPPIKRHIEVIRLLGVLHGQLEETRRRAPSTGLAESRYVGPLNKIEQALTPGLYGGAANAAGQHLTPAVLQMAGTLADLLGCDEKAVPKNVISNILAQHHELE
jgi:hypothetical protein